MTLPGSQAALRGYRLQHLYTLYRLFGAGADDLVIQLEGTEDIDILNPRGNLIEAVQVKALAVNVTASSLHSEEDSFFHRANARLATHPKSIQTIVSFGPFGPALSGAQKKGSQDRAKLKEYVRRTGLKDNQIERVLNALRLEKVAEKDLAANVMERLRETIARADPEVAFTFLSGWLFLAMEQKAKITAADLEHRLLAIGKYVTEEALKRHEWNVNIVPLVEPAVDDAARARLSDEFYRGTYTRYEHVVADLDVKRNRKLDQIDEAFHRKNAVVVHGASGQGKTSLAYRYMRDRAVGLCVEVRLLEDATHALRVAQVLAAHAKAMGTRMVAYIDVAPRNLNWRSLIRELAGISNIRLLITVREEDWTRARSEGMQFEVADVELGFEQNEARDLFEALVQKKPPSRVLNFEEAWVKFGGAGPLMEFAYLVTQSEALRERLDAQVRRLREEVRTANDSPTKGNVTKSELELLRRVVVASGYGARLSIDRLDDELQLPDFTATLSLFEREYLLRRSGDGRFLEGLHPIRSEILAELLTKDEVRATWAHTACACLQAIHEPDIYGFLLHSFTRRERDAGELLNALDGYQPTTWTGIAGTYRALLWFGLRDFGRTCEPLVAEAEQKLGNGDWLQASLDPADVGAKWPELNLRLEEALPATDEVKQILPKLRDCIPDKRVVHARAQKWLRFRSNIGLPKTHEEWTNAAEVTFWSGYWEPDEEMQAKLTVTQVQQGLRALPLEIAAEVSLAASFGERDNEFKSSREELIERFRREQLIVRVDDDGTVVKSHFILCLSKAEGEEIGRSEPGNPKKDLIYDETIRRVRITRSLWPTRERYAIQGYGHWLNLVPVEYDDSSKDISSVYLVPHWLPALGDTFWGIMALDSRPESWEQYVSTLFGLRSDVVEHLSMLRVALQQYFRKQDTGAILNADPAVKRLEIMRAALLNAPKLPRSAVNEWGLASDANWPTDARSRQISSSWVNRTADFKKSFEDYASSLKNFYAQAEGPIGINPRLGRISDRRQRELFKQLVQKATDSDDRDNYLSTLNLHTALERLPRLQRRFRERFLLHFRGNELALLESQERNELLKLWCIWYQFTRHSSKITPSIAKESVDAFQQPLDDARRRLKKYFKQFEEPAHRVTILSESIPWNDENALWIAIDVSNPLSLFHFLDNVVCALQAVIPEERTPGSIISYSFDHFWKHIQIVPLFRGKMVDREMWQFSWTMIPRPNDAPSLLARKLWPREIPEDICKELNIQFWKLERIATAQQFKASYFAMRFSLEHIVSLAQLPEQDALGTQVANEYAKKQWTTLADASDRLNATLLEMFRYSEASNANPTDLIETLRAMIALMPLLKVESRQFMGGLEIESLRSWCECLEAILPQVEAVRLAWIGDVLDEDAARGLRDGTMQGVRDARR